MLNSLEIASDGYLSVPFNTIKLASRGLIRLSGGKVIKGLGGVTNVDTKPDWDKIIERDNNDMLLLLRIFTKIN